ncbi:MAG: hypothetical protein J7L15_01020 [Clostridiales bacterium]|nr:hypothetical protein [Clostridiales bacterium]
MKVIKEESKVTQKFRKLEEYLRRHNIEITFRYDGLLIDMEGRTFVIREPEGSALEHTIPAFSDGTRLQLIDHFIHGE